MTVAADQILNGSSLTAATSYATASRTPTANVLNLVSVHNDVASGSAGTPTLTGQGLTWTQVATIASPNGRWRVTVFRAKGASPTSGALTINFGAATQRACRWVITEHPGTVAVEADAIVQALTFSGTDATVEGTLAAFDNTANATVWVAASQSSGSGSTEGAPLGFVDQASNTWGRVRVAYYIGEDTTPDTTFPASGQWAAIGIELKALDQDGGGAEWIIDVDISGEVPEEEPPPPVDPPPAPVADITAAGIVVRVRNSVFQTVDDITTKLLTLEVVTRAQAPGTWMLTMDATSPSVPLLREINDAGHPTAGIVVLYGGQVVLSGPVRRIVETSTDGLPTITFGGVSDLAAVTAQLAWPQPSTDTPPFDADAYDVRTGPAETLMHEYVSANVGPLAPVSRQNARLQMGLDGAQGATLEFSARWKYLGDVLAELAVASGVDLCFDVRQASGGLGFVTWVPTDRSGEVKFAAQRNNLMGYTYDETSPEATVIIAAGQGAGIARTVVIVTDSTATERIEKFVDRRDIDDTARLVVAAQTALVEAQAKQRLSLVPIDTAQVRYGRDYQLGDKVTGLVSLAATTVVAQSTTYGSAGETYADIFYSDTYASFGDETPVQVPTVLPVVDVVRQVTFRLDESGLTITPLIGTDPIDLTSDAGLYRRLAALDARLNRIEGT